MSGSVVIRNASEFGGPINMSPITPGAGILYTKGGFGTSNDTDKGIQAQTGINIRNGGLSVNGGNVVVNKDASFNQNVDISYLHVENNLDVSGDVVIFGPSGVTFNNGTYIRPFGDKDASNRRMKLGGGALVLTGAAG